MQKTEMFLISSIYNQLGINFHQFHMVRDRYILMTYFQRTTICTISLTFKELFMN